MGERARENVWGQPMNVVEGSVGLPGTLALLLPCLQPHHHHPLVCLRSLPLGLSLPVSRPLPHLFSPFPFPCSSPYPGTNSGCPPPPPLPSSRCCSSLHPVRNSGCATLGKNSACVPSGRNSGCVPPPQPSPLHRCRSRLDSVLVPTIATPSDPWKVRVGCQPGARGGPSFRLPVWGWRKV